MGQWQAEERKLEELKARVSALAPSIQLKIRQFRYWYTSMEVSKQVSELQKTRNELYLIKSQLEAQVQEIEKQSTVGAVLGIAISAIGFGLFNLLSNKKHK